MELAPAVEQLRRTLAGVVRVATEECKDALAAGSISARPSERLGLLAKGPL